MTDFVSLNGSEVQKTADRIASTIESLALSDLEPEFREIAQLEDILGNANLKHSSIRCIITEASPKISVMNELLSIFKVLRADKIQDIDQLSRYQCMDSELFYQGTDIPSIVLFISHRWEKDYHPDFEGKQLAALKVLVANIGKIIEAVNVPDSQRLSLVPTLMQHGVLQAGIVTYLSMMELGNDGVALNNVNDFMAKIGIWYDYACMPQRDLVSGIERTIDEKKSFDEQLLQLHNFLTFSKSLTITLRTENDDYETRGWCYIENLLSHVSLIRRPIVLRCDLVDHPIARSTLQDWFVADRVNEIVQWEGDTNGSAFTILGKIAYEYGLMVGEKANTTPQFLGPIRQDSASAILSKVVATIVQQIRHNAKGVYDFSEVVRHALLSNKIRCTNDADMAFVGFVLCERLAAGDDNVFSIAKRLFVRDGIVQVSYDRKPGQSFDPLTDLTFHCK